MAVVMFSLQNGGLLHHVRGRQTGGGDVLLTKWGFATPCPDSRESIRDW